MEVPGITANELAHACPLLEDPALDLRVNMWLSHHYFLVYLVELLSECSPLIVARLREGGEEELQISAIGKVEIGWGKCFLAEALYNEFLDAVV